MELLTFTYVGYTRCLSQFELYKKFAYIRLPKRRLLTEFFFFSFTYGMNNQPMLHMMMTTDLILLIAIFSMVDPMAINAMMNLDSVEGLKRLDLGS